MTASTLPRCSSALSDAYAAVTEVNAEWLQTLHRAACSHARPFPLPPEVRILAARSSATEWPKFARCGGLLVEAGFADPGLWPAPGRNDGMAVTSDIGLAWLPRRLHVMLAHSTLIVAWHVLQTCPQEASVLLGMTAEVAARFAAYKLADLARRARRWPERCQPRWAHRADIWATIWKPPPRAAAATLLCLKASASSSPQVLASLGRR
jgi:hypothetical protein